MDEARRFLDSETTFMPQEVTNRQSASEWVIQEQGITIEETDDYVVVHSQNERHTQVTELEDWLYVSFTNT